MTPVYSIAIAGAGIGGLATAAFLARNGHNVTVFDQFAKPEPVGSGLVIQPIGQRVLASLGVLSKAKNLGAVIRKMEGIEASNGRKVLNITYNNGQEQTRFGLAKHRASLFDCVHVAAISNGAEIVAQTTISQSQLVKGGRSVSTPKGQNYGPFDLVIDASGVMSQLSPMVAKPLTYGALWGVVDQPKNAKYTDMLAQCYRQASTMIGILPIGKVPGNDTPKVAIFWSLHQNGFEGWQEKATDLWPSFENYASQISSHSDLTMARYSHGTLSLPFEDRLVFIGDAAHRTSPQLGQGANMALLDAMVLAKCLRTGSVNTAIKEYAIIRRWHVRIYQLMSSAFTPFYQSDSRILPLARNALLSPVSSFPVVRSVLGKLVSGEIATGPLFNTHSNP